MTNRQNVGRLYQLTPAGQHMAAYLNYLSDRPLPDAPAASPALDRLESELDFQSRELQRLAHRDSQAYNDVLEIVKQIRAQIAKLEGNNHVNG